jgi:hypothetical protein
VVKSRVNVQLQAALLQESAFICQIPTCFPHRGVDRVDTVRGIFPIHNGAAKCQQRQIELATCQPKPLWERTWQAASGTGLSKDGWDITKELCLTSYKLPRLWSKLPQAKVLAVNRFDVASSLFYSTPRRTISGCLRFCC